MKLIPYANDERPGEVYVRDEKRRKLVGLIKLEDKADGILTPVDSR